MALVPEDAPASVLLITIRARLDSDFPDVVFLTLGRYQPLDETQPEIERTVAQVDEALEIASNWLKEFERQSLA